jgi:uncharacterized protein (DUF1697 family)
MKSKKVKEKYVAFLRGINVGGHHKVPMVELRKEMEKMHFENVVTLLNSGNIIFDAMAEELAHLEKLISGHLEKTFGFPIPTILRKSANIYGLLSADPFKNVLITKDIRLYVSFLRKDTEVDLPLPWTSDDDAFKILSISDKTILSVLDLSLSKTPKVMEALDRYFGTDITTRNWNTIKRIVKKLETSSA